MWCPATCPGTSWLYGESSATPKPQTLLLFPPLLPELGWEETQTGQVTEDFSL